MFWLWFMKELVIIVKNESILSTFSSSLLLNYLNEIHGVSKDTILNGSCFFEKMMFCPNVEKWNCWFKTLSRFFWKLGKTRFFFLEFEQLVMVCVKICYSFKHAKSLLITKNTSYLTKNPWNHSRLMAWGHFD